MKNTTLVIAAVMTLGPSLAAAQEVAGGVPSSVGSFESQVNVIGEVKQTATGEKNTQNMDVGSVKNGTVDGTFFSNVEIKGDIKQGGFKSEVQHRYDASVAVS